MEAIYCYSLQHGKTTDPDQPCPDCQHRYDAHTAHRTCDVCSIIREVKFGPGRRSV